MHIKQDKGKMGENIAIRYLQKNKYNILERNFRCKQGEIDIIAYDEVKKEIVFIEVKARYSLKYGRPSESVQNTKQKHIINSSKFYIYKNKIENSSIRFDVIEVFFNNSKYEINHIKQAF